MFVIVVIVAPELYLFNKVVIQSLHIKRVLYPVADWIEITNPFLISKNKDFDDITFFHVFLWFLMVLGVF